MDLFDYFVFSSFDDCSSWSLHALWNHLEEIFSLNQVEDFSNVINASERENCQITTLQQRSLRWNFKVLSILPSENIPDNFEKEKKIFFLETSGRSNLTARTLCAVESASKHSNLLVIVLLTSQELNLQQASTHKLYQNKRIL